VPDVEGPTVELPAWLVFEGRSLTYPARWVLVELFVQGDRVKTGKASGEVEYIVWNQSLEQLRGCSSSSITRAKNELLERGLLLEWPGQRFVNGVPRSAWAVPLVLSMLEHVAISRHPSISRSAPEHVSITRDADVEFEPAGRHKKGAEHPSISRSALPSRARGLSHQQQQSPSAGRTSTITTNKHLSDPGEGEREETEGMAASTTCVLDSAIDETSTTDVAVASSSSRTEIALAGLKAAKVAQAEQALRLYGVEHVLLALQAWVLKVERREYIAKPGGFVFTLLQRSAGMPVVPVEDLGFARHWDQGELPGNMRRFGR
jgi:hypothetical protein